MLHWQSSKDQGGAPRDSQVLELVQERKRPRLLLKMQAWEIFLIICSPTPFFKPWESILEQANQRQQDALLEVALFLSRSSCKLCQGSKVHTMVFFCECEIFCPPPTPTFKENQFQHIQYIYKLTILQQLISQVQSFNLKSVPNKCSNCTWSARCEINKKLERLFSGGNYASRSCRSWTKETFAKVNGGREGLVAIAGCSSVLFSNVYFQIHTLSSKLLFFLKIASSNVLRWKEHVQLLIE